MLCCLEVWHRVPAQQEKEGEKARPELEPWQLEGCVVWPLLYAGLGKTRECGASEVSGLPHQDTSSTMNLFLFNFFFCFLFSSAGKTYLDLFFLLSSLFIFSSFCVIACLHFFFALFDRGMREKSIWLVYTVHDYGVSSLFCPFWPYFFTAATCLRARIPCQWFGSMTAVNIYWVKYLHPYALKTFMDPSNKNDAHKKYFLWVSAQNSK